MQQVPMVLNDTGVIGLSLNGKSFPATAPVMAHIGEWVEISYLNEGLQIHPRHLDGRAGLESGQGRGADAERSLQPPPGRLTVGGTAVEGVTRPASPLDPAHPHRRVLHGKRADPKGGGFGAFTRMPLAHRHQALFNPFADQRRTRRRHSSAVKDRKDVSCNFANWLSVVSSWAWP